MWATMAHRTFLHEITYSFSSESAGWLVYPSLTLATMYWQWQSLALATGGRAELHSSLKDSWTWPEWETFIVLNHRDLDIDLKLVTLIQTHYFSGGRSLGICSVSEAEGGSKGWLRNHSMPEGVHWGIFPVINYHVWPHLGAKLRVTLGFLSFCSLAHSRYSVSIC